MDASNQSTSLNGSWPESEPFEYTSLAYFAAEFLEPSGVISVVAAAFGIIFNILNITVLSHPKMRNSVNLLLTLLAVSELALLFIYIPYVLLFNLCFDTKNIPRFYTPDIRHARYMLNYTNASVFLHLSASWLIITTACFRFIYVQFPLKSAKLCSYRRAIIAGTCTMLACLLVSVPNIMLNAVRKYPCEEYPDPILCGNNITYYHVLSANDGRYPDKFEHFNFWLYAVFGKFIPAILLLVFTIFLIKVLREANRRKKRLHSDAGIGRQIRAPSSATNEHSQTARMLLAVVALFFLIEFPHGLLLVYVVVTADSQTYDHLGEVIDLATVIAFSLNLIMYSVMSRQYRKLFIEIFITRVINKLRFTEFRAKYKKCSCSGPTHGAVCKPAMTETCALSVNHDPHTVHSTLHSQDSVHKPYVTDEEHKDVHKKLLDVP